MKKNSKKRLALVLKMTIAIGCGSVLASCGNAQNTNGQAQLVARLQQQIAALQGKASQINPTTGQPANTPAAGNLISGGANGEIWASDCMPTTSPDGTGIQSFGEVYMFMGTAWFAEFGFWTDNSCGSNGGTLTQPTSWTNNFGAGYVQGMQNVATAPWNGTLTLVAWDSSTAIGNGIGIAGNNAPYSFSGGVSPTGNNINLVCNLQAGPNTQAQDTQPNGTNNGSPGNGSLLITDNIWVSTQIQLQVYGANSAY